MRERDLDLNSDGFLESARESPLPVTLESAQKGPRPGINVLLFILTVFTTTAAHGFFYSIPLLAILLSHEFGHYFLARKHGIKATLPYFIPAPPYLPDGTPLFFLGTFGALIKIRSPFYDRRALFDVGVAGPLAGAVVAIPVTLIGLYLSKIEPVPTHTSGFISLGSSLLFSLLGKITLGDLPQGYDIFLHPMALAGWVGLLVTSLNLIPVGQLDGGHIIYAMFGREKHKKLPKVIIPILTILGILGLNGMILKIWGAEESPMLSFLETVGWPGWFLWVLILLLMVRLGHPAPINPYTPLDRKRKILGWISLILFILTFTPSPITI